MKFTHLAYGVVAGVALAAGAAPAAQFTYQFYDNGSVCFANSSGNSPACSAGNEVYVPTLFEPIPEHFPSIEVFSTDLSESQEPGQGVPSDVNHFQPGIGIGGNPSEAGPWIGNLEDLVVRFSHEVDVISFGLSGRTPPENGGTALFGVLGATQTPFDYDNAFYGADGQEPQVFVLDTPRTGSSFVLSNEESEEDLAKTGFAFAEITIEFEKKEPEIIPVPPAAPLLGGALALLAWRARRGKRA